MNALTPTRVEQAAPAWILFMRASEWGINPQHDMAPERLHDPEGFLHHSAGTRLSVDPILAMRRLEVFSHNLNYATVAYDAVLHRNVNTNNVTIMGGREGYRSAATLDRNEEGEALCVLGYFQPGHVLSQQPHSREIEGAAWGFVWMIAHDWIADVHRLLGHRDNPRHPGDTSCPGDWLYAWLPHIRQRVTQIIAELGAPPLPIPPPTTQLPTGDDMFHPIAKIRNSDTRAYGKPLAADTDHEFGLDYNIIPVNAVAVSLDVHVVPQSIAGWVDIRPGGTSYNGTATLNYESNGAHSTGTVVGVKDLKFLVRSSTPVHVIIDVAGYWTP